jgi:ATP-dependent RNA helicase DDX3X
LVQDDWQESISAILAAGHSNQSADQNIFMFSATFSEAAQELAKRFLSTEHIQIRVGRVGSTHKNITQQIIWVDDDKKKDALYDLLYSVPPARTLVFVNSKRTCEYVDDYLYHRGIPVTSIHADRTQREREDAL